MATQVSKGYKGMPMEGFIATWYAGLTRKNIEDFRKDARNIALSVAPEADILEVAPGPGYVAVELARLGSFHITGLDISAKFVEIAQANAKRAGVSVTFQQGNVSAMPFADGTFDYIFCRAAFKNFSEPAMALNEIYRVLRFGGAASIVDMSRDVDDDTINREVSSMGLNTFNSLMTRWIFKNSLIKRAYSREQFAALVARSPFKKANIAEEGISLEIHLTK
jgi:ubiquinone/menaquinone biosynthesis C-methylase UbiE